jgi:hypothetical protein
MTVLDHFPPLRGAILQAQSWTSYLHAGPDESDASLDKFIAVGIQLGDWLSLTWRLTFDRFFKTDKTTWSTPKDLEAVRQEVRRLFFTTREAMDGFRQLAEAQKVTPAQFDKLLQAIDDAARLEEVVFRDWPSFTEPAPASNSTLPVDESLAEALGVSVDEARRKMDARRAELSTKTE